MDMNLFDRFFYQGAGLRMAAQSQRPEAKTLRGVTGFLYQGGDLRIAKQSQRPEAETLRGMNFGLSFYQGVGLRIATAFRPWINGFVGRYRALALCSPRKSLRNTESRMGFTFGCLFFCLLSFQGFAQITGKTIKWKVASVRDIVTGASSTQFGDVVTYPTKVEFLPSRLATAQTVQTYTIKKTDSSWTDLDQDGSAVFQVEEGGKKGTVSIKRIRGKVWITLSIFDPNTKSIFDFACSGYEIISQ
jgi:hypothetical protein